MHHVRTVLVCSLLSPIVVAAQTRSSEQTSSTATVAEKTPKRPLHEVTAPFASPASGAPAPLAVAPALPVGPHTRVDVHAHDEAGPSTLPPSTVEFTGQEVLQSAGTWSDLPRYLQTLPGLIGGSDLQNASYVRGGNPFENAFEVDGIEVPNINQLALANSTGGLGSMLDTEMVSNVTFQAGDTGSSHESRLSSLTAIHTLDTPGQNLTTFDVGYSGAGFRIARPIGNNRNMLISARESVTNLFLHDVGLNGSPEFTNAFFRYSVDLSSRNHFWLESLGGRDRLQVTPTWNDIWETNAYDTAYSGWRDTTGAVWQYTLENDAVSTFSLSNSENLQHLLQTSQLTDTPSSFQQDDHDGTSVLKYSYQCVGEDGSGSHFGGDMHLSRIRYTTAQSGAIYSPYAAASVPPAAPFALNPAFSTVDRALFFDLNQAVRHRLFVRAGARYQKAGLATAAGSTNAFLPHASVSVAVGRLNLNGSWNRTAQLPPFATVAGAPGNTSLGLIHAQQFVAGAAVHLTSRVSMRLEAYRKTYTNYPVAREYPQISLATLLPVIDEPFTTLALQGGGMGRARGVELSLDHAPWHGFFARGNASISRSEFTGSDGIYRPGTNALPLVVNVLAGAKLKKFEVTMRETGSSGRAYTPILVQASYEANRSIYDLSHVNAQRGAAYSRLDLAANRTFDVRSGVLRVHAGLLNVLNRQNFFEYLWRPRCPVCGPLAQYGTGIRPDFNISYTF